MGREQFERLWGNILQLGARRIATLVFVGMAVLLIIGGGTYFASRPDTSVLYSGLTRDDVSRVGSALKDAGIGFDVSSDGASVLVANADTARARMLLAEKGLPQSSNSGYELFNEIGSFGLTSFMQEVTKTRALEGELARTIETINGIKAVRVHLVLPDGGAFRSEQQTASASVVIRTENPSDTSSAQAIRHLVAAAVPGLSLDNVTVLNTEGAILASGDDAESASGGKMVMVEQTVNRDIEDKIRRTLTPYLGIGNFQVSVVSRLNMDKTTTNETTYDPSSRVERSVRTVKENALAQNRSSQAPASVQENLPDQAGATDSGKDSNETNERKEELTNYEVSSKQVETAHEGFVVEKLSIAVLINKQRLVAAQGEGADAVPVEHQLMDIEQLVSSAAGFSKERGDQLKVAAVGFVDNVPEALPSPGIMSMLLGQVGSLFNGLAVIIVAALLILFGMRPAVRAILARPSGTSAAPMPAPALERDSGGAIPLGNDNAPGVTPLISEPAVNLIEDITRKIGRSPQRRLEQIVELDEAQAAAILRQWLHQDEAA